MRRYFALALAALALHTAPATAANDNVGTTGFGFLKVGVGARPAALGGAFAAATGDLEASHWNPAGLWGLSTRSATLSVSRYLVDTQAGFLSAAFPGQKQLWALSMNYFSYGSLTRTSADGVEEGSFSPFDLAAYLSVARPVWKPWLKVGANLKAIYSRIDDYSADAYALDLGALVNGPFKGMSLGASLTNLGFVRSGYAGSFKDSLPVSLRLGVAHRPAHTPLPLLVLADFVMPNDGDPHLAFGAEIGVGHGLYLRPGYSTQQTGAEGDSPLGLSAGAGLTLQRYRLDYAFNSYADLGEVHRLALSGSF
jgi:hypothetical protein